MEIEEKQRLTTILYTILTIALVGGSVLLPLGWLVHLPQVTLATLIVVVVSLGLLSLTRCGHLLLPRLGLPALGLGIATYVIVSADGIRDQGIFIYPAVIVAAGLLLGKRGIALFTLLSTAILLGVGWAEMTGRLATRYSADVTWYAVLILNALLAVMAALLYITIDYLTHSLQQSRHSERALHAAQVELRQERDTAQLYLDVAGVIMIALDAEQRVQLINQKGLATLDCELEDIIGQNWFDTFVPARDREKARAAFAQLLNGQLAPAVESFENSIVTHTGQERLIAWHNVMLRDADGRVTGTFSSGEDITERHQAEADLRASEAKLRAIYDGSYDAVMLLTPEGFFDCNPKTLELFGFTSLETFIRLRPADISPPHQMDGTDSSSAAQAHIQKAYQHGSARFEWLHRRVNGQDFPTEVLLSAFDLGDRRVLQATVRDITERKQAEQKLREHEYFIQQQNRAFVSLAGNENLYTGDLSGALHTITETTARALGVQRLSIWFYTPDYAGLRCANLYELNANRHTSGNELYARDYPRYFAALRTETSIVAEDAHTHPHTAEFSATYLTPLGITSMLDIPIRVGGQMTGVLCCEHCGPPRAWFVEEQSFGAAISGVVSTVLETEERLRAEDALRQANAELSVRLQELAMLNYITQTVATRLDLSSILDTVSEMLLHLFNTSDVFISLFDPAQNGLVIMAHSARTVDAPRLVGRALPNAAQLPAQFQEQEQTYVLTCVVPAALTLSESNGASLANSAREDNVCALHIPLTSRGALIGVITLAAAQPDREFTPHEIELAGTIAGQAAGAIENARLFAETQRRAEQMAMLNRIGLTITRGLEITQVLQSLYEQCQEIVALDCFYVALYEEDAGLIHFPFFYENGKPIQMESHQIQRQPGLTGRVIDARQTIYLPDTLEPRETRADSIIRVGGTPIRSYVGVPLFVRSRVIGVLSMQSYQPQAYTPEQIGLLETVATQAAIAIENAQLYTQSRHAEESAVEAQRAAEAANRAKSVFLANMSHELRTPLNAVLGFTQLMANDDNLTAAQRENLGIMSRSGEHLLALINDVLEMSKIEAGRVELHHEDFDLRHMLQGLEEMFQLRAIQKGLRLKFELDEAVPYAIHADESKLRQVLINLLSNAVKFTPAGSVTLRVTAPYFTLHFEIEDTGVGIAPEEMSVLFDAFMQTSSGHKSGEGTGLGLPISQQYVRMMGGELRVSSAPGQGSRFEFDLPLATTDADEMFHAFAPSASQRVTGLAPGQYAPDGGPYRLLVVEDVAVNRKLLVDLLHSWRSNSGATPGLEVREAVNGQEAVESWQEWRPHLIWMDIRMPVLDGYEATRQIRARARCASVEAPIIIALTAGAFEEERERILAEGCDDFVRKPFQQAEIGAVLRKHLGLHFVYAEPENGGRDRGRNRDASASLSLSDFSISPEWQTEMLAAATQGDTEWMAALAEQTKPQAPRLAEQILEWIDAFAYTRILEWLQPGVRSR